MPPLWPHGPSVLSPEDAPLPLSKTGNGLNVPISSRFVVQSTIGLLAVGFLTFSPSSA